MNKSPDRAAGHKPAAPFFAHASSRQVAAAPRKATTCLCGSPLNVKGARHRCSRPSCAAASLRSLLHGTPSARSDSGVPPPCCARERTPLNPRSPPPAPPLCPTQRHSTPRTESGGPSHPSPFEHSEARPFPPCPSVSQPVPGRTDRPPYQPWAVEQEHSRGWIRRAVSLGFSRRCLPKSRIQPQKRRIHWL